jgi:transposase, IS5 family
MRKVIDLQMKIGEHDIADIKFDIKSRDDITKLLRGLQSIYCDRNTRNKIFKILHELIPPDINSKNGRGGMNLWKIFVLGTLRLDAALDYDRLLEIANNHKRVRQMLGHGIIDDEY